MYRLATKRTEKSKYRREREYQFFDTQRPRQHWFVACYVLLLTQIVRRLLPVTLEWIEFGCVHKL